jgi:hypothetical protein
VFVTDPDEYFSIIVRAPPCTTAEAIPGDMARLDEADEVAEVVAAAPVAGAAPPVVDHLLIRLFVDFSGPDSTSDCREGDWGL